MLSENSKVSRSLVIFCLTFCVTIAHAQADWRNYRKNNVSTLPSDIAKKLRDKNTPGERGSCHESNIFIHGFKYFDLRFDRIVWFLGAPDYLCGTNSFIPVIVDRNGNWTAGMNAEEDWGRSDMLDGSPTRFQYVDGLGFFLTSEWRIEGPGNLMYYSADGVTWTSLDLPLPTRKNPDDNDCCYAPDISSLCIADSGNAYITHGEDSVFEARVWAAPIDDTFPDNISWSRVPSVPEDAHCGGRLGSYEFIPHDLRYKTHAGALFDVYYDWAILIPGPTK